MRPPDEWEWDYAEPPSPGPRDSINVDPHGSLDRIEEQSLHDDDLPANPNVNYTTGDITEGLARVKINSSVSQGDYGDQHNPDDSYSEGHGYSDNRGYSESQPSRDDRFSEDDDHGSTNKWGSKRDRSRRRKERDPRYCMP